MDWGEGLRNWGEKKSAAKQIKIRAPEMM